jgi:hypothetical protein
MRCVLKPGNTYPAGGSIHAPRRNWGLRFRHIRRSVATVSLLETDAARSRLACSCLAPFMCRERSACACSAPRGEYDSVRNKPIKKAGVLRHPRVKNHVGLLSNGLTGQADPPLAKSSDYKPSDHRNRSLSASYSGYTYNIPSAGGKSTTIAEKLRERRRRLRTGLGGRVVG